MEKNEFVFEITVKAEAPQGYKPRNLSVTGIGVGNVANVKTVLEKKALEMVKASFKAQQPEVEFKYSVSSVRRSCEFVLTEYAKKGEKTQEADADPSPIVTKQEETT